MGTQPGLENASDEVTQTIVQALVTMKAQLDSLQAKIGVPVSEPAFLNMPPDGIPFNELSWVAIGAAGTTTVVINFIVPGGLNGVIKWIGNAYLGPEFTEGSGAIVWQLLADNQPLPDWDDILGSLGSPSSPSETAPVRIFESQTVQLIVQNVSIVAAGQLVSGRLSGWFYPVEYDEPPETSEVGDEHEPA